MRSQSQRFISKSFLLFTKEPIELRTNSRLGISASRKFGNAVARNRAKRLIREFYRNNKTLFGNKEIFIVLKQGQSKINNWDQKLKFDLLNFFKNHDV